VRPGRLVVLNGPSSAGKSTLAAALVECLDTPWHVLPVDLLHATRSRPDLRGVTDIAWDDVVAATRRGYHRAVAGMVRGGCDVIADHVLSEPWRLADLHAVTDGLDVLLVHVTCAPEVLVSREESRGDRDVGTAEAQLAAVFAHRDCDLTVDTTSATPETCAAAVADLVDRPPVDRAWTRLAGSAPAR
jgi:chloramphenicol 3-O phosphotransferase